MTESSTVALAREYIAAGWSLCAIGPRSKKPVGTDWEQRPRTADHWEAHPNEGLGLIHALSGTCTLDVDDLEPAHMALAAVGVDLTALLAAPDAVRLIGAPGRGKLVYRVSAELTRKALNWPDPETGKNKAVLELRAGSVQDVLPPSIHPETGEPYRWEGDWRALPPLPKELLLVWQHWSEAKRDMEAACPWNDTPALSANRYEGIERRRFDEGESVIAAWNDSADLRAVLQSFGYRKAGPRFISPHSQSGLPGVVILPGSNGRLCFVHHASDPLADGHAHDAFSVWCELEHGGDVRAAVRAAAEMLGISHAQVDTEEGAEIAARLIRPRMPAPPDRPPAPRSDPLPPEPSLTIPIPALADLERWVRLRHHGAKRMATTQGALAFAAAMAARRYVTATGEPMNVTLGVVDTSTAGLRPLRGALYEAADVAGERAIIRGTKLSSDATLYRALLRTPRMFWVSDDYGNMVSFAKKQPSGAIESALGAFHDTYNAYPLYLDPDIVGAKKDLPLSECTIQAPGVVTLALVSEDQMRELTRRAEYGRGAVQQFLFARADAMPDEEAGHSPGSSVPASVVETVKALRTAEQRSLGGLFARATHPPVPAMVVYGPGVADEFELIRSALGDRFKDDELIRWRGIAHGALVTARRLSAALAAWADPEVPVLHADIVRWVGTWVVYHVARSVEWYDAIASDDGDADLMSDIRSVLYAAGPAGVGSRDLARKCRAYRRLSLAQREETMEQMIDDQLCMAVVSGRATRYVDRSYVASVPDPANA